MNWSNIETGWNEGRLREKQSAEGRTNESAPQPNEPGGSCMAALLNRSVNDEEHDRLRDRQEREQEQEVEPVVSGQHKRLEDAMLGLPSQQEVDAEDQEHQPSQQLQREVEVGLIPDHEPEQTSLLRGEFARAMEFADSALNRSAGAQLRSIATSLGIATEDGRSDGLEDDNE